MSSAMHNPDRLHELFADLAMQGLTSAERDELARMVAADSRDAERFELAAAALDLSLCPPAHPLPESVRARLDRCADAFVRGERGVVGRIGSEVGVGGSASADARAGASGAVPMAHVEGSALGRARFSGMMGWLAAAACLGLAALGWMRPSNDSGPPTNLAYVGDLRTQREQMLADADRVVLAEWADWAAEGQGPEIAGVTGDVVFRPDTQSGYMRFVGLPPNPRDCQYQLWIVDERGMSQRISGAIFDVREGQGEVIVPVSPRITVGRPVAFAVTIERPGGTWVSDMTRRVVIATPKG